MKKDKTLEKLHGNVENMNKQNFSKDLEIEKDKNTELITYAEVENTPFTIAKYQNKFYVLLGKNKLTNDFETEKEALEDAKRTDWDRLLQIVAIVVNELK